MSQALIQAARLKPEVRLGQAISEFAASLHESQRRDLQTFQRQPFLDSSDVIRFTEEINQNGLRKHRAWRPYGTRLAAILYRIQLFTRAGDLLVGGSQNIIASGVWAVSGLL